MVLVELSQFLVAEQVLVDLMEQLELLVVLTMTEQSVALMVEVEALLTMET
jgi:hypothetical protein